MTIYITSKIALLVSIIVVIIFIYFKTKNKLTLTGGCVALLTLVSGILIKGRMYDHFFSYIPIGSVRAQKITLFIIDLVVILLFLVYVFYRSERYQGSEKGNVAPDFNVLFKPETGNLIFWILIIIFNLIVYFMGNS